MPELGSPTEAELGVGADNALFSVPEIGDLRSRIKTFNSFGDFSTIGFTLVVLGEPRSVQGGVVGGSYFQVMGLRPVLGRLLDANDDGPNAGLPPCVPADHCGGSGWPRLQRSKRDDGGRNQSDRSTIACPGDDLVLAAADACRAALLLRGCSQR